MHTGTELNTSGLLGFYPPVPTTTALFSHPSLQVRGLGQRSAAVWLCSAFFMWTGQLGKLK